MLVAAAVCPHPPLLVPRVAAGAADELDAVRAACGEAIGRVRAAEPDSLVLVGTGAGPGAGPGAAAHDASAVGSLAPYGVPLSVSLGGATSLGGTAPAVGAPVLPLSLTLGAWLLAEVDWSGAHRGVVVAEELPTDDCVSLGRRLAGETPRLGLLVLGDGSARRSTKAPGYLDERAPGFDAAAASALRDGDPAGLRDLDPTLGAALLAVGRAPWQVLAGAAVTRPADAALLAEADPYGVAYLVAAWRW